MLATVKAAAGRGWGRVRTQAQPVEPRALRQPIWGDAHLWPSVCSQKSETLRAYTTLWPKGPRTGATAGQHNGSGSRSRPKGGGEAFSLKKSLAKAQNASATGTWARGCGPATCGWRGDPGSNCGSCSTLRIPLLSPSSVKGWGWAEAPEGTDKGNSLSSPRPQSSKALGIPPPSRFQTPGFPHARFHGLAGRQTAGRANGGTQSVNFVFARHSQPVGAGFSQVPPSVLGAPYWPHTVGRRLPPSCVWQRSRLGTRLRPLQAFFSQNKLLSSTANCDGD